MKIIRKKKENVVSFDEVSFGEVFYYDDYEVLYMRIEDSFDKYGEALNAINIDTGETFLFDKYDKVEIIRGNFVEE